MLNWMNESRTRPCREKVQDKSPGVRNLWLLCWEQFVLIKGYLFFSAIKYHQLKLFGTLLVDTFLLIL